MIFRNHAALLYKDPFKAYPCVKSKVNALFGFSAVLASRLAGFHLGVNSDFCNIFKFINVNKAWGVCLHVE